MIDLELHRQFGAIPRNLPVLLISGEQDPVGGFGKGVRRVYKQLLSIGMKDVSMKLYPKARHELLNEINRQEVYEDLRNWMEGKGFLNR